MFQWGNTLKEVDASPQVILGLPLENKRYSVLILLQYEPYYKSTIKIGSKTLCPTEGYALNTIFNK
jgi:hypothetical protein